MCALHLDKVTDTAGVAQISVHSIRVSACQDMVRYGVDIAGAMQGQTVAIADYGGALLRRASAHLYSPSRASGT